MKNNYIIIGDSITYGIGDFKSGGYSTMFKNFIVNKDDSKICNNLVHVVGFPGDTSNDILNKLDNILDSFIHDEFDNIIILSIGINDTQEFNGNYKTSVNKYKSNIEIIAKKITDKGFSLIILGLTRIESDKKFLWKPNKYYDNSVIFEYDTELEKLCRENKIKYIPMQDVLQKKDFIDGLHPNQNGHKKIFERIKEYTNE